MRRLQSVFLVCVTFPLLCLTVAAKAQNLTPAALNAAGQSHSTSGAKSGAAASGANAAGDTASLIPRFVYVANRESNDVSAFAMDSTTGLLSPVAGSPFAVEPGPSSLAITPNGKYLFVAYTNSPSISAYQIGSAGDLISALTAAIPAGGRPTKLAVDAAGKFLFAGNGLDGSISAFAIDDKSGELRALEGSPFATGGSPSGIAISPGGHFLYVSDITKRSISAYEIDAAAGSLREISGSPFSVDALPETLVVSASGKELYAASKDAGSVSVYSLDAIKGTLTTQPETSLVSGTLPGDLVAGADGDSLYLAGSIQQSLSRIGTNPATGKLSLTSINNEASDGALLLATEPTGNFLLVLDVNGNVVNRYLINAKTRAPDPASAIAFATGSAPSAIVVANAPKQLATGTIAVTLASSSLLTYSNTTGNVHISPAATNTGGGACAGQIIQLAFSVPSIAVISTAADNPATSVCILTGQTDAAFSVATAANSGSATLTGFATGFTNGTVGIGVSLRQLTIALPFTNIAVGHTITGTLTLTNPAPTGGVTVTLATNAAQTATISPATVSIAAGATTASFTATGVAVNTAQLSASVAGGGYGTSSISVTILPAGMAINLPHNLTVAPGQTLPYPISIGAAASSSLSVSFSSSGGPGTATISPNPVVIPAGATTPTTQPTIKGGALGPLNMTGSATGYASDLQSVTVSITLTLNPASKSVQTGQTATLTLSASSVAPTGGFVINTAMDDPSKASVPTTVTIPAGSATATVTITGVAAGTTTLRATAPGAVAASSAITVNAPPGITLVSSTFGSSSFSLGRNGISGVYGNLGVAAPAGNLSVTLTSNNPTALTLSTSLTTAGATSITVQVAAGSTSIPQFYALARTASGTATITATASGYANGAATVTLVPSGFIVQSNTNTATFATPSPVYVTFAQLDPATLNYVTALTLRPGAPAVGVTLKNSDTAIGTLASSSLNFQTGDSQKQTTFTPLAAGAATISFSSTPSGYSTPANYQSAVYTVTTPNSGFSSCYGGVYNTFAFTLGKNAQSCGFSPLLAVPAPIGGRIVTLKSNDTSKLLLTTDPTKVGVGTITVNVAAGAQTGSLFYIQTLSRSASATITETVSGFNSSTLTVNLTRSGFIVQSDTTTTTFSTPSPVYVTFAQLDATTSNYTGGLTLRPGAPAVTVPLKNSNTAVGTLGSSSIVFNPGDTQHQTTFQPTGTAAGVATISFSSIPTDYSTPANYATAVYTVNAPNSGFSSCYGGVYNTFTFTLGKNAQSCGFTALLANAAPSGGRVVKLVSNDTSKLLLTTDPTKVGVASITVNVPAGAQTGPLFYIQTLSRSASATITETVPGYNPSTLTVNLTRSGFIVQSNTTTTTFSTPSPVYVTFAQLDATTSNYTGGLTLRPGAPAVTVPLKNSNTAVGTLGSSSIVFNPGDTQHQTTFQPTGTAAGVATISFSSTPTDYSTPANYATAVYTVNAPNSGFSSCYGGVYNTFTFTLGKNAQSCGFTALLAAPAPTGGRTVTLTSGNPSKLLLSTSATVAGSTSVTLNVAAGAQSGSLFYIQSLSDTGTVTVTETIPGFNPATLTVSLAPSGFIVQSNTNTTTFSTPSPVYVTFAQLDPTTLNYTGGLGLRPGAPAVTVALKNSNTAIGTLAASSFVFNPGDTQKQTTFSPLANGAATISFNATPSGYTAPSNYNQAVYTVTAPNSGFSSCYGGVYNAFTFTIGKNAQSCGFTALLAAPAPTGGRIATLTSSDTSKLLISSSQTAVGGGTLALNIAAGAQTGTTFYLQALAQSGSATISETIPGYNPSTLTVNFTPSGFIVQSNTTTTTFSPASPVYVTFAQLDPSTSNYTGALTLRPGVATVTVGLANSNTAVGTLGASSIAFNAGDSQKQTTFTPTGTASGVATISFSATPSGYTAPGNYKTAVYTVNAPAITLLATTVGKNLQTTTYGYLAQAAPTGGRTVTLTSSDTSKLLLSTTGTATGTGTLTFNLAAGQTSIPTFYVQALAGSGTATITVTAAGYSNGTGTITLYPAGFALQASNFTTHLTDNPTTLTIVPAALDPMYLNVYQVQQLRPNQPGTAATLTLTDQSGTSPVGNITLNPVVFQGADNPNSQTTSFQPLHAGTTLIKVTSPSGFTNASSQVTATVVP